MVNEICFIERFRVYNNLPVIFFWATPYLPVMLHVMPDNVSIEDLCFISDMFEPSYKLENLTVRVLLENYENK